MCFVAFARVEIGGFFGFDLGGLCWMGYTGHGFVYWGVSEMAPAEVH